MPPTTGSEPIIEPRVPHARKVLAVFRVRSSWSINGFTELYRRVKHVQISGFGVDMLEGIGTAA